MIDGDLRARIYRSLAATGRVPTPDPDDRDALERLHDAHALVLDGDGNVRMALPFSAVPTQHMVRSEDRSWWANCAWDALAIPLLLGIDGHLDATWADTGEPVDLEVVDGELSSFDGFVGFAFPAARWWDDIVET